MCGIVGYIGHNPALPIILEGLHRLEYRGYDSAGIALLRGARNKKLESFKTPVSYTHLTLPTKA